MALLDSINSPTDLKRLKIEELPKVASEIRQLIIETVAQRGGHLAASLGAVEIAIALHYIFDVPNDAIVWDVGHQAYAHKILTGRRAQFNTIRTKGGLSGFPNKDESPYDFFTVGHGSTSISTALGLVASCGLAAASLGKKKRKVAAVIGDGSLVGGMALEALNHAGHFGKDLIVILNDNEFSISPSVGAMSKYLNRILANPTYNKVHKDVENLLKRVPWFGFRVYRAARKLEEGLKSILIPGIIFEELGFKYFGPIDGHDIKALITTVKNVMNLEGPLLIHVVTRKGKGYGLAEKQPEKFHGTGPFYIETGEAIEGKDAQTPPFLETNDELLKRAGPSCTEAFSNAMVELGRKDKDVVAITAAMPEGTGLAKFGETFPDRFFNVGMAEQHAVAFAAGLAKGGFKPVCAIYSTFLQRSYDQIVHDVALQNLHVIFAIDRGGVVGEDGPTHHGVFDIAYLRHIPNLVLMAPKDTDELKAMLEFAAGYNGPIALRYPRGKMAPVIARAKPEAISEIASSPSRLWRPRNDGITLGKAEVLREGADVTILALGSMVAPSLKAADLLKRDGIEASVINARFASPIDEALIKSLASKGMSIATVEEGITDGGFGSRVLEFIQESGFENIKLKRLGFPDKFIEHAKRDELLKDYGLNAEGIANSIK